MALELLVQDRRIDADLVVIAPMRREPTVVPETAYGLDDER